MATGNKHQRGRVIGFLSGLTNVGENAYHSPIAVKGATDGDSLRDGDLYDPLAAIFIYRITFRPHETSYLRNARHNENKMLHHGRDIDAAGDEVEIAVRKVLGRKLPSLYYVGHGHIVDEQLHQSSQLDVIIANNTGSPILFRAENKTEFFPYEGVYAFGEVKSSYDNNKHYIHAFSDTLRKIRAQLQREPFRAVSTQRPNYDAVLNPFIKPFGNPLFSFMFFADAGDFKIEQIRELYQTQPAGELPNIICILNKGVIASTLSHIRKNGQAQWEPVEPGHPQAINLIPENNDDYQKYYDAQCHWSLIEHGDNEMSLAANLAHFYYPLIQHLQRCQLTLPNLTRYVNHLFDTTTSTFIFNGPTQECI